MFVIRNSLVSLPLSWPDRNCFCCHSKRWAGWHADLKWHSNTLHICCIDVFNVNNNPTAIKKIAQKRRNWEKQPSNDDEQEPNQMNRNKVNGKHGIQNEINLTNICLIEWLNETNMESIIIDCRIVNSLRMIKSSSDVFTLNHTAASFRACVMRYCVYWLFFFAISSFYCVFGIVIFFTLYFSLAQNAVSLMFGFDYCDDWFFRSLHCIS